MNENGTGDLIISRYWWILPTTILASTLFTVGIFTVWKTRSRIKYEGYLNADEDPQSLKVDSMIPLPWNGWRELFGRRIQSKYE